MGLVKFAMRQQREHFDRKFKEHILSCWQCHEVGAEASADLLCADGVKARRMRDLAKEIEEGAR